MCEHILKGIFYPLAVNVHSVLDLVHEIPPEDGSRKQNIYIYACVCVFATAILGGYFLQRERERERTQNSELYYSRIKILGSCLFLQSVPANLHARERERHRGTQRQTERGRQRQTETEREY